jgi:hypothetical protein
MPKGPIFFTSSGGNPPLMPLEVLSWETLPLLTTVTPEKAEMWLGALEHLCVDLNLGLRQFTQNDPVRNAGVIEIASNCPNAELKLFWRKERNQTLFVYVQSVSGTLPESLKSESMLYLIEAKIAAQAQTKIHRNGQICYRGKKWTGEFWLNDNVRLGPTSIHYEDAIGEPENIYYGAPRVVMVDALIDSFGQIDWSNRFDVLREEIALFLTVMTGNLFYVSKPKLDWFTDHKGNMNMVGWIGYSEPAASREMPLRAIMHPIPNYEVLRPDLTPLSSAYPPGDVMSLPTDACALWTTFLAQNETKRTQFRQAAAKFQEALYVWDFRRTLSFTLCVAACEALKPLDSAYDDSNYEYVIRYYLGKPVLKQLNNLLRDSGLLGGKTARIIRNRHFHRGEFFGGEFQPRYATHGFKDPTFSVAERQLRLVTQAALIEWLRRE